MHSTPLVPQRMTKSQFFSELRAPDAAAIRSRPSNWDLNPSSPMIHRGRLTKRHPSPLATSVSAEDISTLGDKTHSGNTYSSAPPSFRINHYGKLSQENLPNPDTPKPTSSLSKKQRSLRGDMHASSCFACCSGLSILESVKSVFARPKPTQNMLLVRRQFSSLNLPQPP